MSHDVRRTAKLDARSVAIAHDGDCELAFVGEVAAQRLAMNGGGAGREQASRRRLTIHRNVRSAQAAGVRIVEHSGARGALALGHDVRGAFDPGERGIRHTTENGTALDHVGIQDGDAQTEGCPAGTLHVVQRDTEMPDATRGQGRREGDDVRDDVKAVRRGHQEHVFRGDTGQVSQVEGIGETSRRVGADQAFAPDFHAAGRELDAVRDGATFEESRGVDAHPETNGGEHGEAVFR